MDPVRQALYDTLKNDKGLMALASGVYLAKAPRSAVAPYIIYGRMSEVPTRTFDGPSLDKDVWMVKGVGEAAQAEDIALAVRQLLDRVTLPIAGKVSLDVYRVGRIEFSEDAEGEQIHHAGYEFKVDSEEQEA